MLLDGETVHVGRVGDGESGTLPGWRESTVGARTLEALPSAARGYLDRLHELAGVPIAMVSTGADRDETILRHDPFA